MSDADRRGRVARVLAIAKRVADPGDPLGAEVRERLLATSGLSGEGVALALSRHLETSASEAEIASLLASVGEAERCHVVLSANVCTGALRAIALATATAPRVALCPSRRDSALCDVIARELAADRDFARLGGTVEQVGRIAPSAGDEVFVYGRDETIEAIGATLPEGVVLRGHGAGFGVALIRREDDLDAAAEALASDVVPFDQRGCLSPRVALVEGEAARAEAFASALHEALAQAGSRVPRGPIDLDGLREVAAYCALAESIGAYFAGPSHGVGLDASPRALVLPPAARIVHVTHASAASVGALLDPFASHVTTVGESGPSPLVDAVRGLTPHARTARLGAMQRPPLDGPVDRRGDGADPRLVW